MLVAGETESNRMKKKLEGVHRDKDETREQDLQHVSM